MPVKAPVSSAPVLGALYIREYTKARASTPSLTPAQFTQQLMAEFKAAGQAAKKEKP